MQSKLAELLMNTLERKEKRLRFDAWSFGGIYCTRYTETTGIYLFMHLLHRCSLYLNQAYSLYFIYKSGSLSVLSLSPHFFPRKMAASGSMLYLNFLVNNYWMLWFVSLVYKCDPLICFQWAHCKICYCCPYTCLKAQMKSTPMCMFIYVWRDTYIHFLECLKKNGKARDCYSILPSIK